MLFFDIVDIWIYELELYSGTIETDYPKTNLDYDFWAAIKTISYVRAVVYCKP